jgi:hypothetical protein
MSNTRFLDARIKPRRLTAALGRVDSGSAGKIRAARRLTRTHRHYLPE